MSVLEKFSLPPVLPGFEPRYNIAPTQDQWTLALDSRGKTAVSARRWGLIPWWAKDPAIGNRMINARSDSLTEKPAFRDPVRERRCLVLADGYYEWTGTGRSRIPIFFHMPGDTPFVIAGLWDRWGKGESVVETCTVITTDASPSAARYHHRMPALLNLDDARRWIDAATPLNEALALLRPFESAELECHEVSRFVNSPANDSPECIRPVLSLL